MLISSLYKSKFNFQKTKQCSPVPLGSQEKLDLPVLPSDPMASTLDSLVKSVGDRKTESSLKFMMELFRYPCPFCAQIKIGEGVTKAVQSQKKAFHSLMIFFSRDGPRKR